MVTGASDARAYRLSSIDMLRGLAIVIMAIDHVRDFFLAGATQDPMADPNISPALFATRWITHFCAPVFAFTAGMGAFFWARRRTRAQLSRFLLTRGLWNRKFIFSSRSRQRKPIKLRLGDRIGRYVR